MVYDIDSFFFTFKNVLIAEKDLTLTLKSEAARAKVTLGNLHFRHGHHHHASNGNLRSRRQDRQAAAEVAEQSPEKVNKVSEEVEVEKADAKVNATVKTVVTEDVTTPTLSIVKVKEKNCILSRVTLLRRTLRNVWMKY